MGLVFGGGLDFKREVMLFDVMIVCGEDDGGGRRSFGG